ncbi:MAG TPA: hypothetical protein VMG60_05425 [Burkholderiaceae bacterium]|nr:hypothetical protein [Burkholderiaceae bacterium]
MAWTFSSVALLLLTLFAPLALFWTLLTLGRRGRGPRGRRLRRPAGERAPGA